MPSTSVGGILNKKPIEDIFYIKNLIYLADIHIRLFIHRDRQEFSHG